MRYKIYGVKNQKFRKEMREALYFFEEQLNIGDDYEYVLVKVKVTKNIDVYGYCNIEHYDEEDNVIELAMEVQTGQTQSDTIHTLAHEMVHIRQYVTGKLNDDMSMWNGEKIDSDSIDYDEHPWEIEAQELGDKLYDERTNAKTKRQ